ncbi:MAG: DUF2461 domain-containing protein [Bacteroidales bacterium]|nr:DUF2461 domain-containing protein [Bacteroidales bacterium]
MNTEKILEFLGELKQNNTREWFSENKSRFEVVRSDFEAFINRLIPEVYKFDPGIGLVSARDCMFRIYKDIRFSKDKSPYKTNFGAFIAENGRKSVKAGYYVHLDSEESFLGGGMYMPSPDILRRVRQEIYFNAEALNRILEEKDFREIYGGIHDMEDKLKNPPRDYPVDFRYIELLKHKSYSVWHTLSPDALKSGTLLEDIACKFSAMAPFNAYLNHIFDL